jgi:hypothetical protein
VPTRPENLLTHLGRRRSCSLDRSWKDREQSLKRSLSLATRRACSNRHRGSHRGLCGRYPRKKYVADSRLGGGASCGPSRSTETFLCVASVSCLAFEKNALLRRPIMILPQVHLRKPCYDFYFLQAIEFELLLGQRCRHLRTRPRPIRGPH